MVNAVVHNRLDCFKVAITSLFVAGCAVHLPTMADNQGCSNYHAKQKAHTHQNESNNSISPIE
jgi:hypothetical protein